MPIPEVIEVKDSNRGSLTLGDDGSISRDVDPKWILSGFPTYAAAEAKAEEIAPREFNDHRRKGLDIDPLGNGFWIVTARYNNPAINANDPGGDGGEDGDDAKPASCEFDTTGATQHVTQAYSGADRTSQGTLDGQLVFSRPDRDAPNLKGAINVQDMQVNGVDITVPQFSFSETWHFSAEFVIAKFIGKLYETTGKINNKPWRVFDEGEVLFMGARGTIVQGQSSVPITFSFQASPNRFGFDVGDILNVRKQGWDHMSVMYETSEDSGNIIKVPKFLVVECVYPSTDFEQLRIGNGFPRLSRRSRRWPGSMIQ